MLYKAVKERILKEGHERKYVSYHEQGQPTKYVPVYRSPSGEEVFEGDATVVRITTKEMPDGEHSRVERECAIEELKDILFARDPIWGMYLPNVDRPDLMNAIKTMAVEADLKLQVGVSLAEKLEADEFYHEFPEAEYVVSFLVDSALKDAIVPLTSLMEYATSWDHSGTTDSVHNFVRTALRGFVADSAEFQAEAARAALALHAKMISHGDYYRDFVGKWAVELLENLANSSGAERDWAREQLQLEDIGKLITNLRA
jgi:hypothetical protein